MYVKTLRNDGQNTVLYIAFSGYLWNLLLAIFWNCTLWISITQHWVAKPPSYQDGKALPKRGGAREKVLQPDQCRGKGMWCQTVGKLWGNKIGRKCSMHSCPICTSSIHIYFTFYLFYYSCWQKLGPVLEVYL